MMKENNYPISVSCPWCEKSKTLADQEADIKISCQCPKCGNFYNIDFKQLQATKAMAKKIIKTK